MIHLMLATLSDRKRGQYSWLILITLLFSLLFISKSFAQNQANMWYFGQGAGLNFNTNPPAVMENGNTMLFDANTGEGVGSISDANGNLLFYSNGEQIFAKNHTLMLNGAGGAVPTLNGNQTTTQTGLIVPMNGFPDKYFVISTSDGNAVEYVIVDMALNTGLGGVEVPSLSGANGTLLLADASEGALLVPVYTAANVPTNEYWVIFHGGSGNPGRYAIYKTAGSTITFHAFQTIGYGAAEDVVIMKTNSCFDKIATSFYNKATVEVLPFNNVTGVLSAPTLTLSGNAGNPFLTDENYGVEFSPSSRFLYVSESGLSNRRVIYQFDLNAGTGTNPAAVLASKSFYNATSTFNVDRFGALQLGPDGKIYIPAYTSVAPSFISVVPTPDAKWTSTTPTAAEFEYLKYTFNSRRVGEGLPPVLKNLLTNVRIFYNNACEGGITNFSYVFGGTAVSASWDFGDPGSGALNTSTSLSPSHVYALAGTYTVTLSIVDNCGRTRTSTANVIIKEGPVVSVPTNLCASSNILLDGTGTNRANYIWSSSPTMSPVLHTGEDYTYNGALPYTIYVKDPTPLATYTVGHTDATGGFGGDIEDTRFELFTNVTLKSFNVRVNTASASGTMVLYKWNGTAWVVATGAEAWSQAYTTTAASTLMTFSPNRILSPGKYRLFAGTNDHFKRNTTNLDGGRDVLGVIDVYGDSDPPITRGGPAFNISLELADPCGIRALSLTANCPAPVTLLSFTGEKTENLIALDWTVTDELNNSHFLIQRSSNENDFSTIGQVQGRGTAAYGEYSFLDHQPRSGLNYYRLAQVDFDGTITYSKIIAIDIEEGFSGVIYPNPFTDQTVIHLNSEAKLSIELIDITGRTITSYEKAEGQADLNIGTGIAKGTYLLRIITENKVYTSKIIKE